MRCSNMPPQIVGKDMLPSHSALHIKKEKTLLLMWHKRGWIISFYQVKFSFILLIMAEHKTNSVDHLDQRLQNWTKWKPDSYVQWSNWNYRGADLQIRTKGSSKRCQYIIHSHCIPLTSTQLRIREKYCCAVTGAFDCYRAIYLREQGRDDEISMSAFAEWNMDAAHIIPFSSHDFDENGRTPDIVCHLHIHCSHLTIFFLQNSATQHKLGTCFRHGRVWMCLN